MESRFAPEFFDWFEWFRVFCRQQLVLLKVFECFYFLNEIALCTFYFILGVNVSKLYLCSRPSLRVILRPLSIASIARLRIEQALLVLFLNCTCMNSCIHAVSPCDERRIAIGQMKRCVPTLDLILSHFNMLCAQAHCVGSNRSLWVAIIPSAHSLRTCTRHVDSTNPGRSNQCI